MAVVRPPRSFSVTSTRTATTTASDPLHLLLPPRPRPRSGLPSIRMLRARQQVLTPPPSDPLILQPQVRGLSVQTQRRVPEIQHHPSFTPWRDKVITLWVSPTLWPASTAVKSQKSNYRLSLHLQQSTAGGGKKKIIAQVCLVSLKCTTKPPKGYVTPRILPYSPTETDFSHPFPNSCVHWLKTTWMLFILFHHQLTLTFTFSAQGCIMEWKYITEGYKFFKRTL